MRSVRVAGKSGTAAAADTSSCPSDGIRFGVEAYEAASALIPIFDKIGAMLLPGEHKHLMSKDATGYVAVFDWQYDVIRDPVETLDIDLDKL